MSNEMDWPGAGCVHHGECVAGHAIDRERTGNRLTPSNPAVIKRDAPIARAESFYLRKRTDAAQAHALYEDHRVTFAAHIKVNGTSIHFDFPFHETSLLGPG